MKDYSLVYHLAKMTGTKIRKSKDSLNCRFPFGNECDLEMLVFFNRKRSESALYNVIDVYLEYGQNKFASYDDLLNAIVKRYDFFQLYESNGSYFLEIDLVENNVEHTASTALTSLSILIAVLNELLGTKAKYFTEEDWRNLHRDLLVKQKRNYSFGILGGVGMVALSIVLMVLYQSMWAINVTLETFITLLAFLFIPLGVIGIVFCTLMYYVKKHQLKRSINSRKFGR